MEEIEHPGQRVAGTSVLWTSAAYGQLTCLTCLPVSPQSSHLRTGSDLEFDWGVAFGLKRVLYFMSLFSDPLYYTGTGQGSRVVVASRR
jgi:hypothetical protein